MTLEEFKDQWWDNIIDLLDLMKHNAVKNESPRYRELSDSLSYIAQTVFRKIKKINEDFDIKVIDIPCEPDVVTLSDCDAPIYSDTMTLTFEIVSCSCAKDMLWQLYPTHNKVVIGFDELMDMYYDVENTWKNYFKKCADKNLEIVNQKINKLTESLNKMVALKEQLLKSLSE